MLRLFMSEFALASRAGTGSITLGPFEKWLGGYGGLGGQGRIGESASDQPAPAQGPRIRVSWPWSQGEELPDTAVLDAVPKKRTSHRKKRQRQLAGNNQTKPLRNLNRCPACGHYKRAHALCMHCVGEIQQMWRLRDRQPGNTDTIAGQAAESQSTDADRQFNYPERLYRPSEFQERLSDKEAYVLRRPRTLPVPEKASKLKKN